jgi:hypothetical protein
MTSNSVRNIVEDILLSLEIDYTRNRGYFGVKVGSSWVTGRTGTFEASGHYSLAWSFHEERRLGDHFEPNVLSIDVVEIAKRYRGIGVMATFIKKVLDGDHQLSIPMRFLHFRDCGPELSNLLDRLDFHRYESGSSVDWWHSVHRTEISRLSGGDPDRS